ncbi:hypothetical protein BRD20_02450 [Halobacteriales archaeon SW_8_65_20]|nr:MAG: hypothetical protein BRC71_10375 [Halobacteriales archaeon QH_7_65_31]PSQ30031.1 MAG: hypothetical protein BRD16_08945 [Halobacteriales archaeon SW_6_65_46]PSQ53470.1 MAG: hypothetical protein BRD20_02450 [Halobacteriales archaeon SW_8_65_20]
MRETSTVAENETPKMALFCRECGHASELSDDWLLTEAEGGYWIVCPDCETAVISQPVFE